MSALDKFGVGAAEVASLPKQDSVKYPNPVAGRVAHIDADFMAYQVSAESKEELDPENPKPRKTWEDMQHNAYEAVDHIRRMAAAETAVLHVTTSEDKGGRAQAAILKEYQGTRKDRKNRPERLDDVRAWLGSGVGDTTGLFTGLTHTDQEADDGMAQAAYSDPENAIVCSADKDLLMVPGWKLDMYNYSVYQVKDPFGWIELDRTKSSPKVKGAGTKFFWAQCLMGDQADSISGVPAVPGRIWQAYAGTKAYQEAYDGCIKADNTVVASKFEAKLHKLCEKPKACGAVLTYDILKDAKNDKQCFQTVKACYVHLEKDHGYEFRHWKTGKRVTPTQALLSEMRLLWMRRYKDKDDVLNWLKETVK